MAALLRHGFQWPLDALIPFFAAQAKKYLIRLLTIIMIVLTLSALLCAFWHASDSMDYSPMTTGHAVGISNKQWWKPPDIMKILKDTLLYVATMLPSYEPLTVGNLLKHRDQLGGVNYMVQACFNLAIDVFNLEPHLVQQNARMVIQCDGPPIEFLSGNGDCEISVFLLYEKIHHNIRELTPEMYLARLSVRKEPLSINDLLRVRRKLKSWGVLSDELGGCLEFAVQEFAKEPSCVQTNAHMVVDCGGQVVTFVSGRGENDINVYDVREGTIHYRIKVSGPLTSAVRFFTGNKDHVHTPAGKLLQLE
ncbi:uncharacterized protein LOC134408152 [Elgaria multicarinata webbii]|uniref:uncharacterized protein LOC134408152 n=1 Tax=Elgaria multicarinata webbii TaxID=159646 RepID=UPI002FCD411D